jgi:hypothetical protein
MRAHAIMEPVMSKEEQPSDKSAKLVQPKVNIHSTSSMYVGFHLIPDIQALKKSVSTAELRKQGFTSNLPRLINIVPSTDNSGKNSLDVIVHFPKTMSEKDITSAQTSRMLSWIQDTILARAESDGRWPYVFVRIDGKDTHVASKH